MFSEEETLNCSFSNELEVDFVHTNCMRGAFSQMMLSPDFVFFLYPTNTGSDGISFFYLRVHRYAKYNSDVKMQYVFNVAVCSMFGWTG